MKFVRDKFNMKVFQFANFVPFWEQNFWERNPAQLERTASKVYTFCSRN